jgi:TRAP-type C4-dicarboxylate transport system permease small subunit
VKTLTTLARWFAVAGMSIALATAIMTVTSILMRALLKKPIQGDIELVQFGIGFAIALAVPYVQAQRTNIIVDFFTQKASFGVRNKLDALGAFLLGAMYGLLAWRTLVGAIAVKEAHEMSMILSIPNVYVYALLAPGLALAAIIAFAQAIGLLRRPTLEVVR